MVTHRPQRFDTQAPSVEGMIPGVKTIAPREESMKLNAIS